TVLGVAVITGFYMGKLVRLVRLPSIIGYMIVGVLLGPSLLLVFKEHTLDHLSFITEIALGFVAFSIGTELNVGSIWRQGKGVLAVVLAESFAAFFFVLAGVGLLTRDLPMALIFGAMAPASAPAGTVAVIQEYRSQGPLTKALYAVVAIDDGLAIIIFAFAAAIARSLLIVEATGTAESILPALWAPFKEIVFSTLMGGVIGFAFCQMVRSLQNSRDIFILLVGSVMLATGISTHLHLSLILTNIAMGFVLANIRREAAVRHITAPLLDVMPLVFILFFCLAGAHLKLAALPKLGLIGVMYIVCRLVGKIIGARMGGRIGDMNEMVRKYIGLGILSQAGVAIGIALIARTQFTALGRQYDLPHATRIGAAVLTIVTATSIFFEILGPIMTKVALHKAGEIPPESTPSPTGDS
ncbi:MAG: cation:proton antiporter, partial [Candidatus Hydrogenedentes bacterium]|nr:cation:proton antiporter [Candidatus Hydrogenedentota bacterium]